LGDEEARARLAQYGPNELAAHKPVPAWRRFLSQFQDVLVILLLIATGISAALWLLERDADLPYEAIAIFAVVLLNAMMGSRFAGRSGRHHPHRGRRHHSGRCGVDRVGGVADGGGAAHW